MVQELPNQAPIKLCGLPAHSLPHTQCSRSPSSVSRPSLGSRRCQARPHRRPCSLPHPGRHRSCDELRNGSTKVQQPFLPCFRPSSLHPQRGALQVPIHPPLRNVRLLQALPGRESRLGEFASILSCSPCPRFRFWWSVALNSPAPARFRLGPAMAPPSRPPAMCWPPPLPSASSSEPLNRDPTAENKAYLFGWIFY